MDIRFLKTFIEVAEQKHFGKAAERLYITQAAVSARIKQLEDFYKTKLIVRDKQCFKLTSSGEALLSHAYLIVSQMEQSKVAISIAKNQKESFNIAATPNVWDAFFSRHINDTLALFEDLVIGTEISVMQVIQRKLAERTLDIGLLTDPIKDEEFASDLIGYFDLSLVGSKPEFNEAEDYYIWIDWGITFQKEHALYHNAVPSCKTSTAAIALEVILTRGGFAYLPTQLAAPYLATNDLYIIPSELQIKRPVYMAWKQTARKNALIAQFKNLFSSLQ